MRCSLAPLQASSHTSSLPAEPQPAPELPGMAVAQPSEQGRAQWEAGERAQCQNHHAVAVRFGGGDADGMPGGRRPAGFGVLGLVINFTGQPHACRPRITGQPTKTTAPALAAPEWECATGATAAVLSLQVGRPAHPARVAWISC